MTFDPSKSTVFERVLPRTAHMLTGKPTTAENAAHPIPPKRRQWMLLKTVVGAVPLGLTAWFGAAHDWKQEYVIGLAVLAAIVASGQLVTAPLKDVVTQVVRLIVAVRSGRDSTT